MAKLTREEMTEIETAQHELIDLENHVVRAMASIRRRLASIDDRLFDDALDFHYDDTFESVLPSDRLVDTLAGMRRALTTRALDPKTNRD